MNHTTYLAQRLRNTLHSAVLIFALSALLAALGYALAGSAGLVFALAASLATVLFSMVYAGPLAIRMLRGRPLDRRAAPQLHALTRELATRAGLPAVPSLYYSDSAMPNAATTGTAESAAIVLSRGLLNQLTPREIAGVLAHELAHLQHNDIWTMQVAAAFSRLTSLLSSLGQFALLLTLPVWMLSDEVPVPLYGLALMVFAPLVSQLLTLALSRTREFDADATAATLLGTPEPLMHALSRLEGFRRRFMTWQGFVQGPEWSQSHPATRARLERLSAMSVPPR